MWQQPSDARPIIDQSRILAKLLSILLIAGIWLSPTAQIHAQHEAEFKPYVAVVTTATARIYAAPADTFYGTEELEAGDEVHVYRHDPGGWCAIRPTENSFSMVQAQDIELLDEQVARVVIDGAKCWVGTNLTETDQPLFQVRLKKGEKLRLLGVVKEQYVLDEGQPDWIQIVPPRGEFRWIRINQIKKTADISIAKKTNGSQRLLGKLNNPAQQQTQQLAQQQTDPQADRSVLTELLLGSDSTSNGDSEQPLPSQHAAPQLAPTPASEFDIVERIVAPIHSVSSTLNATDALANTAGATSTNNPGTGGWRPAQRPINEILAEVELPRSAPAQFESGSTVANAVDPAVNSAIDEGEEAPANLALPALDVRSHYSANIQRMELELTQQVIKEPRDWNLAPLVAECKFCLENSNNAAERHRVERLLAKTKQFQRVQNGYATSDQEWPAARSNPTLDNSNRQSPSVESRSGSASQTASGELGDGLGAEPSDEPKLAGKYDAIGILNKLVRDNGRTRPSYVLQDKNGKILHHIAPAPGVNLHRYLNKNIAIVGQRGFHRQLNLPHITAERVIELQSIRR